MQLKRIHRILSFKQAPWLKSYIDFNTVRRAAARNDLEKARRSWMNFQY